MNIKVVIITPAPKQVTPIIIEFIKFTSFALKRQLSKLP